MGRLSVFSSGSLVLLILLSAGRAAVAAESFQPSWQSLAEHQAPDWLLDAKFGIYAHWGVYSVPAFDTEWYAKRMYDRNSSVYKHHVKTYGDPAQFGYKEFIPQFKAEKFDADKWAELIEQSGARYAGIAVVHHDGFLLWHSEVNRWNAGNMGPKRDLYGELAAALRRRGLNTIATFHHIRTFNWYLPGTGGFGEVQDQSLIEELRRLKYDLVDPQYADLYWNSVTGKHEDFIAEWQAKVREVIDKYRPDVVWFDGGQFQDGKSQDMVLSLLSYYHNQAAKRGEQVEVLNKLPVTMKFNFPRDYGVLTYEEGRDRPAVVDRPWIDDMKISTKSWGYIEGQTYKSANEIIDGLIDRTSRGGGLLLSLCPKADGSLPGNQDRVLQQMGDWLRANGEAIYGTRPWKIQAEGDAQKLRSGGRHPQWKFLNCDASDIRFTRKGNTLYAIALGWPNDGQLSIRSLTPQTLAASGGIRDIRMLGSQARLSWSLNERGLAIKLPPVKPNDIAYALRIEVGGELE